MRNKSEFVWLAVLLVGIAVSVRWFTAERLAPSAPAPNVPAQVSSPSPDGPVAAEYPRSRAPLSRTSFRVEQVASAPDGKRRIYSFFIHGSSSGADYEAMLAYDGRTTRASGHLTEAEYKRYFERLEQHGAWKLVDVPRTSGTDDHVSIFVQAGDWSNNVTFGSRYKADRFASAFLDEVFEGVAGTQRKALESSLAAGG